MAQRANSLSPEAIAQVRQLLAQGHQVGSEHADKRRFQTSSWQSCGAIDAKREADVVAALEHCLAEHRGEYVRLIGVDRQAKRRIAELIIQRPSAPANASNPPSSNSFGASTGGNGSSPAPAAATHRQRA